MLQDAANFQAVGGQVLAEFHSWLQVGQGGAWISSFVSAPTEQAGCAKRSALLLPLSCSLSCSLSLSRSLRVHVLMKPCHATPRAAAAAAVVLLLSEHRRRVPGARPAGRWSRSTTRGGASTSTRAAAGAGGCCCARACTTRCWCSTLSRTRRGVRWSVDVMCLLCALAGGVSGGEQPAPRATHLFDIFLNHSWLHTSHHLAGLWCAGVAAMRAHALSFLDGCAASAALDLSSLIAASK